jgi:hypothetical protein
MNLAVSTQLLISQSVPEARPGTSAPHGSISSFFSLCFSHPPFLKLNLGLEMLEH